MKIYMNLYSDSRFIIDVENIELRQVKENDKEKFRMSDGSNYALKIVAYDKDQKEYTLINEEYFQENADIGNKKKYLLEIMDSISQDYINGYSVPDFNGLVKKAINDVKENNKKKE